MTNKDRTDAAPLVRQLPSHARVATEAEPLACPPPPHPPAPSQQSKAGLSDLYHSSTCFFAVEVDGLTPGASATIFPDFPSLLQYVTLKVASFPSRIEFSHPTPLPSDPARDTPCPPLPNNRRLLASMTRCGGEINEEDPIEAPMQQSAMVSEAAEQLSRRSFTWVNLRTTDAQQISQLGELCGLHSLTIEDIITDSYEKCELYHRRGYLYCMVDSQDIRGNSAFIHVLLFHDWVFTIHDRESAAIFFAVGRLQEEVGGASGNPSFTSPLAAAPRYTGSPAWVLYNLLDVDVDWLLPVVEQQVQEAREVDELVFVTASEEQPAVLRRISHARSRIHGLKQRTFAKQRLLMVVSSASTELFIPVQVKLYLRDICDHIMWCAQQLNSADEILVQANNNYLACVSIEAARLSNRTNSLMKHLAFLATIFVPFTLVAGLMGMNVRIPFQEVPHTGPFWGIVAFFGLFCVGCYATFYHVDRRKRPGRVL